MRKILFLLGLLLPVQLHAQLEWPEITREAKPWTRWWWLGSAVDSANLTRELEELARVGFGGVEVTSIYGIKGQEDRHIPYFSDRWIAMLGHAAAEANRLGMGLDMPPGSGWKMGGPEVPLELASRSLRFVADTAPSGAVTWSVEIRNNNEQVKRPAPGGEGNVVDVLSEKAVAAYFDYFGGKLERPPEGIVRSFFHDSYEYSGDGSAELFDFFAERRGYDLREYAAALAGEGDPETVARVRSDYRQTMDEMLLEHLIGPFTDWAHQHGSLTRNQAHGSPGNILDLYAASDIPETEIFGPLDGSDADPLISKFASSAAHVAGKPRASAESMTWLGEHWTVSLNDVKQAVDGLFVSGINHVFFHGTAYSPDDATWPGWLFYASTQFNDRNAFWRDIPALNQYIARVQSVMQSGVPDNDVLLYWPIWDNWHDAAGRRPRMDFR
ncbi:MAG TPA: glycosyl hydrolase, partial [Longimicrobiaceae bacterium]